MSFIQIIAYKTSRWDEVQALVDQYRKDHAEDRTMLRTTVCMERDNPGSYVTIVEFPSYEAAMANSNLPGTKELAEAIFALCDTLPTFRNLDVKRVLEN